MSLPLGASTTASPVPLQLFSADWIREVSGGAASALLLNCSLLVARVALSVAQVAGTLGWATARLSPVARARLAAARLARPGRVAGRRGRGQREACHGSDESANNCADG